MSTTPSHLPTVWLDALKVLAAQLIVWHHLALYGPMPEVAYPLAPALIDLLAGPARLVVQVFLVIGGFLAAEALWRSPGVGGATTWRMLPGLMGRRHVRLARPLAVALPAAVLMAWWARAWIGHPSIPAAPDAAQLLAHALLLQDVLGMEALSAGLWYLAIDFQLYALLAVLAAAVGCLPTTPAIRARVGAAGVVGAILGSLLVWNRDPELDVWALYFLGSYGLGVLACWARRGLVARRRAVAVIAVAVALALTLQWRDRIALAGLVALLLALAPADAAGRARQGARAVLAGLSRQSYALFLIHYSVALGVGAVIGRLWPDASVAHASGMVLAWLLSMLAAAGLHHGVENRRRRVAPVLAVRPALV
ncbi:MAG: acyltransferase family protein [Vitreoscilla sp.]|nr:acyltransferase family protein [Vitreoscilla sp.]